MKSNKIPVAFALLLASVVAQNVHAGPEGRVTADPTYADGGNDSVKIAVAANASIPVLISSKPANWSYSGKPSISVWRHRQIINTSNVSLMILPDNKEFTTFSSTIGIVLGTGPISGLGDAYTVPHQGEVWGIWASGANTGGAGGEETFWNPLKR